MGDKASVDYVKHKKEQDLEYEKQEGARVAERLVEEAHKKSQGVDYDTRKLKKPERMQKVVKNKEEGNSLLKSGSFKLAIGHYDKALGHCDKFFDLNDEEKKEVSQVQLSLYNNIALANVKRKEWKLAVAAADKALGIDATIVKAHYRKAMALEGLKDFRQATKVLNKALNELKPPEAETKAISTLVTRVSNAEQKQKEQSKKVYGKMFG